MKTKLKDFQELFTCRCHSIEHQFVISLVDFDDDDPDVFLEIYLSPDRFFKRLVYGIKYIFGYRSRFGAFEEIILKPEDAPRLRRVVDILDEIRCRSTMNERDDINEQMSEVDIENRLK